MIELLPLEKEDCINILNWNANKDTDFLKQWAGEHYSYPLTVEQILERINNFKSPQYDIHIFKIIHKETNKMIGTIELLTNEKDMQNSTAGRFLLDEAYRGNGFGQAALEALCNIAFYVYERQKVVLGVYEYNLNAIKCYEKVGFKKSKFFENTDDHKWNGYQMTLDRDDIPSPNLIAKFGDIFMSRGKIK